jgi:hypothetical protein
MTRQDTTPLSLQTPALTLHEHGWLVESRHSTSAGYIVYVRCADCGARRIDAQQAPQQPPEALSRETPAAAADYSRTGPQRRA